MTFVLLMNIAAAQFPEYTFITPLTPSAQKAAFHVKDSKGNDLCLKVISPDYDIDRVAREIQALQELNHPNVVRLIGYTHSIQPGNQKHYIIEEFIEGRDLNEIMLSGIQARPFVADLFASLSDGLAALADHSIVHRDLKPNNIRVRNDGTPVLIDFGLARLLSRPDLTPTAQGAAIGTLKYFSPEQCRGTKQDIEHRTDLFALGIILYEMLIDQHPFLTQTMTESQLMDTICECNDCFDNHAFLALPPQWQIIIKKLLSKERAMRPYNAHQVSSILRSLRNV